MHDYTDAPPSESFMPFYLLSEEFICFCGRSSLNIRMSVPKIKHVLIDRMHIKVVNSQ